MSAEIKMTVTRTLNCDFGRVDDCAGESTEQPVKVDFGDLPHNTGDFLSSLENENLPSGWYLLVSDGTMGDPMWACPQCVASFRALPDDEDEESADSYWKGLILEQDASRRAW